MAVYRVLMDAGTNVLVSRLNELSKRVTAQDIKIAELEAKIPVLESIELNETTYNIVGTMHPDKPDHFSLEHHSVTVTVENVILPLSVEIDGDDAFFSINVNENVVTINSAAGPVNADIIIKDATGKTIVSVPVLCTISHEG